jgi:hypothetical protein
MLLLHAFWGGQTRMQGRATNSSLTSLELHRSQLEMIMLVHVQIIFPVPHSTVFDAIAYQSVRVGYICPIPLAVMVLVVRSELIYRCEKY